MVQYRYRKVVAVAVMVSLLVVQPFLGVSQAMASPSAGLAWGPVITYSSKSQTFTTAMLDLR